MSFSALPPGLIDTHVHTSPDVVTRLQSSLELLQDAKRADYRGVVLKSHVEQTATRAALLKQMVWPEGEVIGGLALNQQSCGGLNPTAVQTALRLGARIIWMPTISAAHQVAQSDGGFIAQAIQEMAGGGGRGISLAEADFTKSSPLCAICDLVAEAGATLATGHLSPAEIRLLVPFARARGVARVLVTHPELPSTRLSLEDQAALAALGGVWFERCFVVTTPKIGVSPRMIADAIQDIGVETTVLATDLGQPYNPPPITGMLRFLNLLAEAGIADDDLEQMVVANPAHALGLN